MCERLPDRRRRCFFSGSEAVSWCFNWVSRYGYCPFVFFGWSSSTLPLELMRSRPVCTPLSSDGLCRIVFSRVRLDPRWRPVPLCALPALLLACDVWVCWCWYPGFARSSL